MKRSAELRKRWLPCNTFLENFSEATRLSLPGSRLNRPVHWLFTPFFLVRTACENRLKKSWSRHRRFANCSARASAAGHDAISKCPARSLIIRNDPAGTRIFRRHPVLLTCVNYKWPQAVSAGLPGGRERGARCRFSRQHRPMRAASANRSDDHRTPSFPRHGLP